MNELNKAIATVISNKYKKDCKDAHEIVEAAGYTIEKYEGCYYVRNNHTHRYCYMVDSGSYYKGHRWVLYWGSMCHGSKVYYGDPINLPFDYVHMLDTPYNRAAYTISYDEVWNKSVAKERYICLKHLKQNVERLEEETQSILKSIAQMQKRLINTTEAKVKCVAELNACRKEYGLK